jgi:microfibrillar-associated protein 1
MSGTVRKQAPRLARPAARYWKGKAPKGATEVPSDSDEDEEPAVEEEGDVLIGGEQDIVEEDDDGVPLPKDPAKFSKSMNVSLKDVNISKDGKVTVAGREESGRTVMEDETDGKVTVAGREESGRTAMEDETDEASLVHI